MEGNQNKIVHRNDDDMLLLRDTFFITVSITVFAIDLLYSQIAILMAFLSKTLGLSNADIGLVTGGFIFTSAIAQPVFGLVVDKVGPRWIASGGLFWTAGLMSIALILQNADSLPLLILAGLGSGAFFPAGTMVATSRGKEHFDGRAATAVSIFFLFGQTADFIGPAIGGFLLERFSAPGLLVFTIFAIPVGVNAIIKLRPDLSTAQKRLNQDVLGQAIPRELRPGWLVFAAFTLIIVLWSWSFGNMVAFLPKYLLDGGIDLRLVGIITSLYTGSCAVGIVLGGALSDRWGRWIVIFGSLILASLSLYSFASLGISEWMYIVIPLVGIFIGACQSPLVVMAQSLMPNRMATASGLILGFMFSTEAIGVYFSGLIADASGLETVFKFSPTLVIVAALLTFVIKGKNPKSTTTLSKQLEP